MTNDQLFNEIETKLAELITLGQKLQDRHGGERARDGLISLLEAQGDYKRFGLFVLPHLPPWEDPEGQ